MTERDLEHAVRDLIPPAQQPTRLLAEREPTQWVRELVAVVFEVRGVPAPQGSKRAFRNKYTGRIQQVESSPRLVPWRQSVASAAAENMGDRPPLQGPLRLTVWFRFGRPRSHFGARGLLRSAPRFHAQRPDLSKLVRALEDALTTIVWRDDDQVAEISASKRWDDASPAGASVLVEVLR